MVEVEVLSRPRPSQQSFFEPKSYYVAPYYCSVLIGSFPPIFYKFDRQSLTKSHGTDRNNNNGIHSTPSAQRQQLNIWIICSPFCQPPPRLRYPRHFPVDWCIYGREKPRVAGARIEGRAVRARTAMRAARLARCAVAEEERGGSLCG